MTFRDEVNNKITKAFIEDNPFDIVLNRRTKVPNDSGGFTLSDGVPLPAQRMTLINNGPEAPEITSPDGKLVVPTHTLVGAIDSDMERRDEFVVEGRSYVIQQVSESRRDWAKRGAVTERTNGNG